MKLRLLIPSLFLAAAAVLRAENEVGFIEKFALAKDREAALQQLVPGTEEYYFFHALHYQNSQQPAKLAAILEQWAKRFPGSAPYGSPLRRLIENRSALLAYDASPEETIKFLTRHLSPSLNHVQEVRDQKPDLPASLDPKRVVRSAFLGVALSQNDLGQLSVEMLEDLVRDKTPLRPDQRRAVLARLTRPDLTNLVELIAEDLKGPENRQFGEFAIHGALLPAQLDTLATLVPRLANESNFVLAKLRKMAPSADADAEFDPAEREAWLERAWAYVKTLPPAFNTLKAHVLYARLDHDRKRGLYDEARFREYLLLPRQGGYVNPRYLEKFRAEGAMAELNAEFPESGLSLPAIRNDEALVREYFLQILAKAESWEPWAELVRDTWLKPVFAEAKILNGIGEPEKWAPLLSPAAFQALKERVDVEFPSNNQPFMAPGDEVAFDVTIKNTPKLIVKIYEINALSFFLSQHRPLNTDLNLDGLVANAEQTHDGDPSPFRRVRRTFRFPELKGKRGAWIIEFIGGGKSSRALVRKGQYKVLTQTGPAGDLLTVLDESGAIVPDAAIWADGRKYTALPAADPKKPDPRILIPFTAQPGRRQIVVSDATGGFASLTEFENHAEQYQLDAQFHIEREQLLGRREATLGVRTSLLLGDAQVALDLLQETKLTITSTTLDGISATTEIKAPKLLAGQNLTQQISVPERLARLTATLTGKVQVLSKGGEKQDVSASASWEVNGIETTAATNDGHLARIGDGFVFELLGKNAEPQSDQQVVFRLFHQGFSQPITVPLRSDEKGRIQLGALPGISRLECTLPGNRGHVWPLSDFQRTWPSVIHATTADKIEVPWASDFKPQFISLLEMRGGQFVANRSDRVAAPAAGAASLLVGPLEAGDYSLRVRDENSESHEITLRVTAGKAVRNWLVGANRNLEVRDAKALQIDRVQLTDAGLSIKLSNAGPFSRVHVAATRYLPQRSLFGDLAAFTRFSPSWGTPDKLPNLYSNGRDIGDEYRYIIERRYAAKFPGNMLTRPGLLLNPWEKRKTGQEALSQQSMQEAMATAGGRQGRGVFGGKDKSAPPIMEPEAVSPNLDFLAESAPVLWNLAVDKDGMVVVPKKLLGDRQFVQVYAEDLTNAVWLTSSLPEQGTKLTDLRLNRPLDPAKPFTEKKQVSVLAAGETLKIEDLLTTELETYDTLSGVHALFTSLNADPKLARFAWLLQWPTLKDAEKRAKYSEFACHELNFFLSRKDPEFFAKVIQPYLRNKKDPTFMDDYLLERDLRDYLAPTRYERLNAAERALLAVRLPGEAPNAARHLRELWELLPPNPENDDRLFETALRGRMLEQAGEWGFGDKRDNGAMGYRGGVGGQLAKQKAAIVNEQAKLSAAFAGSNMAMDAATPAAPPVSPPAPVGRPQRAEMDGKPAAKSQRRLAELNKKMEAPAEELKEAMDDLRRDGTVADYEGAPEYGQSLGDIPADGYVGGKDAIRMREAALKQAFYRRLGPAREWAENNYFERPIQEQVAALIPVNAFWRDYAAWVAGGRKGPFLSRNVAEASRSFPEMMLALGVLDLPFTEPKHTTKTEGNTFTLTASGPVIVFHKEIKAAEPAPAAQASSLLLSENFFRESDRYRQEGNERFDKFVSGEFLAGVVYGAQVVVTNPTSSPIKLDLLTQIPQGALPARGSKPTASRYLRLEPYTTLQAEYYFYFPTPGKAAFAHYPANAAIAGKTAAMAKATTFNVVLQLSEIDKTSWDYLSQYGSDAEVFAFLESHNLERLNLERIAWRARKSLEFFRRVTGLLEQRHIWNEPIYRYALVHKQTAALRQWLSHREDFVSQCGPYLESPLLTIDPVERRAYEHLEYSPLVNQRAHRIGSEARIANPELLAQYQSLLNILAYKPALNAADDMSVTYYLFVQDRVEEALARFHSIKAEALPTRLQHDYFRCYAAFYEEKLADARAVAAQYKDHPVDRWRNLFAAVATQLDEIEGKNAPGAPGGDKPDRESQQAALAQSQPTFDFKVENRTIALNWRNLSEVTINYYLMDPEFLFSSSPFVSADPGRFSIIKPSRSALLPLPAGKDSMELPLPPEFAKANVLVEILGAGQQKAQPYHANTLKLTIAEQYGRLEVRDQADNKPLGKAYVKVYARLKSGQVRFFKDGYTDLRGRFDYASINSPEAPGDVRPLPALESRAAAPANLDYPTLKPAELDQIDRMSVLVLSEANGAAVREAAPPRE